MEEVVREYSRHGHSLPDEDQSNWIFLLEKHTNSHSGKLILDVGCGKGQFALDLSRNAKFVVGVDTSQAFKDKDDKNCCFINADCHHLPFKNESFDIVTTIGMLEHIEGYEDAIIEMKRVLKTSGYMLLFAGPTPLWRFIDTPAHRSIITRNPSVHRVRFLLKDGNVQKVWGENISYRLLSMNGWRLRRGPRSVRRLFEVNLFKVICINILKALERRDLEQNFCIIYTKKKK